MAQKQLEVPFYLRKNEDSASTSKEVHIIESCKKKYKKGKFMLSVAESARGLQYWLNMRLKQVNDERVWAFDFGKPKAGFLYGEYTAAGGNRFFGTSMDFDIFKTQLFPTEEYIQYLIKKGNMIIDTFKQTNQAIKNHHSPLGVMDNACLAELFDKDNLQLASQLIQRIDTYPFERHWAYQTDQGADPPSMDSINLGSLGFSLKYVKIGESEESSKSGGMCFQMPLAEYIALCRSEDYKTFCIECLASMPELDHEKPKKLMTNNGLKRKGNGENAFDEEEEEVVDVDEGDEDEIQAQSQTPK